MYLLGHQRVKNDCLLYYEPMNAKAAAEQIKKFVDSETLKEEMKQRMDKRLELFCDYDKHFNDIMAFLVDVGKRQKK